MKPLTQFEKMRNNRKKLIYAKWTRPPADMPLPMGVHEDPVGYLRQRMEQFKSANVWPDPSQMVTMPNMP